MDWKFMRNRFLALIACFGLLLTLVDRTVAREDLSAPASVAIDDDDAAASAQESATAADSSASGEQLSAELSAPGNELPAPGDVHLPATDVPAAAGELPAPAVEALPQGEEALSPGEIEEPTAEAIAPGVTNDALALGMQYLTVDKLLDLVQALLSMSVDKPVPVPLLPKSTIVSAGVHLSPEVIDLLERRASEPEFKELLRGLAPDVADMAPTLSGLGPLLRKIKPEIQVVFGRTRESQSPGPGKLIVPTVAFIYQPADIKEAKPRLLGLYLAVIGEMNKRAKERDLPLFKLKSFQRGEDGFVASARLPKDADLAVDDAYPGGRNFSPAIAMLGNRFIVSSNADLLNELMTLVDQAPAKVQMIAGPRVDVTPAAAAILALDNMQHLLGPQVPGGPGGPVPAGVIPHLGYVRQFLESMPNQPRPLMRVGPPPVRRVYPPRPRGTPL
jgi:hypothetical protein